MKPTFLLIILTLFSTSVSAFEGRINIKLKNNVSMNILKYALPKIDVKNFKKFYNKQTKSSIEVENIFEDIITLNINTSLSEKELQTLLLSSNMCEFVDIECDVKILGKPNDPALYKRWEINETESDIPGYAALQMEDAWNISTGSQEVVVAIIDTGLKYTHPELSGRIWENSNEIADNGIDDDNNGYIDDVIGWDFGEEDNDPDEFYINKYTFGWHGTNITGILASNGNNGIGTAGNDWNCKVMPLKAFDERGSSNTTYISEAIIYAADNGADVINISVGFYDNGEVSKLVKVAVDYAYKKGVIIVSGAGNTDDHSIQYPAKFNNVICVGASDKDGNRASPFNWGGGSCFGEAMDFLAPGESIASLGTDITKPNQLFFGSGTSQAAPQITSLISLMLSVNKNLTFEEVYEILKESSHDEVGRSYEDVKGWDQYHGWGNISPVVALEKSPASGIKLSEGSIDGYSIHSYPNPFLTSNLKIKLEVEESGDYTLSILDLHGTDRFKIDIPIDYEEVVDLSNKLDKLPRGAYYITLSKNSKTLSVIKRVKVD